MVAKAEHNLMRGGAKPSIWHPSYGPARYFRVPRQLTINYNVLISSSNTHIVETTQNSAHHNSPMTSRTNVAESVPASVVTV